MAAVCDTEERGEWGGDNGDIPTGNSHAEK